MFFYALTLLRLSDAFNTLHGALDPYIVAFAMKGSRLLPIFCKLHLSCLATALISLWPIFVLMCCAVPLCAMQGGGALPTERGHGSMEAQRPEER